MLDRDIPSEDHRRAIVVYYTITSMYMYIKCAEHRTGPTKFNGLDDIIIIDVLIITVGCCSEDKK